MASALCALLAFAPARAQEPEPLALPRLATPPEIDGPSDELAWREVAPLPMAMYEPVPGGTPTERTEVRVGYDDQYLYLALRAYDSDPAGIRANSLYRDRLSGDDFFSLMLDTFDDNESAVSFTTTPAGMRRDAAIAGDGTGAGAVNSQFNTFWDVATRVTDEGWFAEMRIPFSSLRFQERDGRVLMGLLCHRYLARRNERVAFPELPANLPRAYVKPSLARTVALQGVQSRRPVYLAPYLLGGSSRATLPAAADGSYPSQRELQEEVGLDVKYGLTDNLTLDVTLNTDFAQAEADDQQVNLTRFSLFYPEKRQFFQERAGIFEFRTAGGSRLFHSRRIGLTDRGEPVRILGGARLVGRAGEWDVGMLNMQTAAGGSLPAENLGVLRVRRQLLNPHSYLGGMATSRMGLGGGHNLAFGVDGMLRLPGDNYLSAQWAHTVDGREAGGAVTPTQGGTASLMLERRRREGLGYTTWLNWAGPHFDPGIGFIQRQDFTQSGQQLSHSWLPGPSSSLIWHAAELRGFVSMRNQDRRMESLQVGPAWLFELKSGDDGSAAVETVYEDVPFPFTLSSDASVPAGRYHFHRARATYDMSTGKILRTGASVEAGTFYDGWGGTAAFSPVWNVSRHLELGGEYAYNHYLFPARDQDFRAHLLRLRVGAALDTRISANTLLQFNSARSAMSANLRFRFNLREGRDLWVVYNEALNSDRHRVAPSLPLSDARTLLVKYVHTFVR